MKKPEPPELHQTDDDAQAFRRAMANVARLRAAPRVEPRTGKPAPLPRTPVIAKTTRSAPDVDPWATLFLTDQAPVSSGNTASALPPHAQGEFAQLFGPAEPINQRNRLWLETPKPPPHALQRDQDHQQVLREALSDYVPWSDEDDSGDELLFLRPGISRDVLRKLRRGQWVAQAEIDFHGNSSDEARERCGAFLRLCLERGLRCVRMVHGKGLGSKNREPVLKPKLKAWLTQRDDVLAFCPARPFDGGSGAVIVLLRPARPGQR